MNADAREGARANVPLTKLQAPSVTATLVARPRALGLVGGGRAPVTLVAAPAGSGKTTLLATWSSQAQAAGTPVAWITLDGNDNEPFFLWSAVLLALESTAPPRHAEQLRGLSPPQHEHDPSFIVALCAAIVGTPPLWLVLDDAHLVVDARAQAGLEALLLHLPRELHLVIAARFDPGLGLHRLRLDGRLHEIDAASLVFTVDETSELMGRSGVDLSRDDVTSLTARTEGWAAGLRMAALTLQRVDDRHVYVEDFTGADRSVADYLVAEVLARPTAEQVDFLLSTSVCAEFTVELAAELSGRDDAGAILHVLEHANALIVRLGRAGSWYRYHALLREYLETELERRDAARRSALHETAARWFEHRGATATALEHAVRARADELVLELLHAHGLVMLMAGEGDRIRAVIRELAPPTRDDRMVVLLAAIAALDVGDTAAADLELLRVPPHHVPDTRRDGDGDTPAQVDLASVGDAMRAQSEQLLALLERAAILEDRVALDLDVEGHADRARHHRELAERRRDHAAALRDELTRVGHEGHRLGAAGPERRLEVLDATVRLHRARLGGDLAAALAGLEAVWNRDIADPDLDLLATANRGTARFWVGRHDEAEADITRAVLLARAGQRDYLALHCLSVLAGVAAARSDFLQMERQARVAIDYAEPRGWARSSRMSFAYVVAAWSAYQTLDDGAARHFASLAVDVLHGTGDPTIDLAARTIDAIVTFDQGAPRDGLVALREAWRDLGDATLSPALTAFAAPIEQRMAFALGEEAWAREVVDRVERLLGATAELALVRAVLHYRMGRSPAAESLLASIATGELPAWVATTSIDAALLEGSIANQTGHDAAAHRAVTRALEVAAPRRALRPFLDAPVDVFDVLVDHAGSFGASDAFADEVASVVALRLQGDRIGLRMDSAHLTQRELEILRHLPSLLSVTEIAELQHVSVNTVKSQLQSIYRKLGVATRRAAIEEARRRSLL